MNPIKVFFSRVYQFALSIAVKIANIPMPKSIDSLKEVKEELKNRGLSHPIIVTSKSVANSKYLQELVEDLQKNEIFLEIYKDVTPDPTFKLIYNLKDFYLRKGCDSIIACGGGSVIDASKALGALVTKNKPLEKLKGILKVKKKIPFLLVIPTTAGTGSEATVSSVILNERTNDKFAITDLVLVPKVVLLDDNFLKSVPKGVIRNSGMDAYCHAIEAYLSTFDNKAANEYALRAIKLVYDNLIPYYEDSYNDEARKNMQLASYYAGISFTRVYVGYVHSIAHAIGGIYHLPHGYLVAVLLPYVLEAYDNKIDKKVSVINSIIMPNKEDTNTNSFITSIRKMNESLGIMPLNGLIKESDYDILANRARKEANPYYPVPKELSEKELKDIIKRANSKE